MNRRMRNRTYGGVGGDRRIPAPYPMLRRLPQSRRMHARGRNEQDGCAVSAKRRSGARRSQEQGESRMTV